MTFLVLLFFLLSGAKIAVAQTQIEEPLKLGTELVVVDAQVLQKKTGASVGSLQRQDFRLYEDGVEQQITHFSQDKLPLSILLLVDTSGSVWGVINDMRAQMIQSLQHLKESDEVALMATASRTQLIQDYTTDRRLIADKIQAIDKKALGRNGILLHDALFAAAEHLRRAANPASRRVVIVVTDNLSTQMIGKGHGEKEALEAVFEAGGVICGLHVSDLNSTILKFDPAFYVLKPFLFTGNIYIYAEKTGGLVLKSNKAEADKRLAEIIDRLRTRYAIGYVSTNTKADGKFRRIKLQLSADVEKREGRLDIVTRRGYYARKGEEAKKAEPNENRQR
jgi:VWFA-related protein